MVRKIRINLALVGATGLVGRTMLAVLEERALPVAEIIPVASPRSRGAVLQYCGREFTVSTLEDGLWRGADAALLSAGAGVSREWIPELTKEGITCIDNSSAFRQTEGVPLVVPEVNAEAIGGNHRLIANPNCSTIQLVVILAPLERAFGLEKVVVATYQSASGVGQKGKARLQDEIAGEFSQVSPFPYTLFDNVIPGIGDLVENGYYFEEWKLVQESRKILGLPDLRIFPTAVRVPVRHCHGEVVHMEFRKDVDVPKAREVLKRSPGVVLQDDPEQNVYPLPLKCIGKDDVFVGRIRQIPGENKTLDLWIVADNLRKGAATNAVQILECVIEKGLLK